MIYKPAHWVDNDPEIESKCHHHNLSCFIQITRVSSLQDVIIGVYFSLYFLKLSSAGKGL